MHSRNASRWNSIFLVVLLSQYSCRIHNYFPACDERKCGLGRPESTSIRAVSRTTESDSVRLSVPKCHVQGCFSTRFSRGDNDGQSFSSRAMKIGHPRVLPASTFHRPGHGCMCAGRATGTGGIAQRTAQCRKVSLGYSPKIRRYSSENRPRWLKPMRSAMSVTRWPSPAWTSSCLVALSLAVRCHRQGLWP